MPVPAAGGGGERLKMDALAWDEVVPGALGMLDPNGRAEVLFTTVQ